MRTTLALALALVAWAPLQDPDRSEGVGECTLTPRKSDGLLAAVCVKAPARKEASRRVAPSPRATELIGECVLDVDDIERVLAELRETPRDRGFRDPLQEHALEHGWASAPARSDWVEGPNAAKCSAALLDRMAEFRGLENPWDSVEVFQEFAMALERNDRLHHALALIERGLGPGAAGEAEFALAMQRSLLAETAGDLCERRAQHARALEYAGRRAPIGDCGFSVLYEEDRIARFRARNLLHLGHRDEFLDLASSSPSGRMLLYSLESGTLRLWIESELAAGRASNAEQAIGTLLARVAPGDETAASACGRGLRLWTLSQSSKEARLRHLGDLSGLDEALAETLARGLDDSDIAGFAPAFEVVDGRLRDPRLAAVLAASGREVLTPWLEAASSALGEKFRTTLGIWELARRRYRALSTPH